MKRGSNKGSPKISTKEAKKAALKDIAKWAKKNEIEKTYTGLTGMSPESVHKLLYPDDYE